MIRSISRSGVALATAALAVSVGVTVVPGVVGAANASTATTSAHRPVHKPKPTPTPTPTPSPTPAPSTTLAPGAAPTSVPAATKRVFIGVVQSIKDPTAYPSVTTAGRYTVEYDTSLPAAFNTIVDGTYLAQTGVGYQSTGYSQTFFLGVGQHSIGLGGPEVYGPANAYLVGPL